MNRLEKLRELRKTSLTLTMGEGDDKFDVEIPLPTPYETQEIILSKTNKNMQEDQYKTSAEMIQAATAWIGFNLPKVDGTQLVLKDFSQKELDKLVTALLGMFFQSDKKQALKKRKGNTKSKV